MSAPDIADVLARHEWTWKALTPQRVILVCSCGDSLVSRTSSRAATLDDHRAHVAAALAPVLAAAVREAEQRALREAADEAEELRTFAHGKNPTSEAHVIGFGTARRLIVRLLRDRADRITEPVSHEAATSGEEASKA